MSWKLTVLDFPIIEAVGTDCLELLCCMVNFLCCIDEQYVAAHRMQNQIWHVDSRLNQRWSLNGFARHSRQLRQLRSTLSVVPATPYVNVGHNCDSRRFIHVITRSDLAINRATARRLSRRPEMRMAE